MTSRVWNWTKKAAIASGLLLAMNSAAITVNTTAFDVVNGTPDGGDTTSLTALQMTPGTNGIGLDEAIVAANNSGGGSIDFDVAIGTLSPGNNMPVITTTINIDGGGSVIISYSSDNPTNAGIDIQGGMGGVIQGITIIQSGTYGIALSGTATNYQILDCTLINGTDDGIRITGPTSSGHTIRRCFIGTDGATAMGNSGAGIRIYNSSGNTVGATGGSEKNVISGNTGAGIIIEADAGTGTAQNNNVFGNYIGVDSSGTTAISNFGGGVSISNASNNMIGSPSTSEIQVISGNGLSATGDGIKIQASAPTGVADNNAIHGNYIGLNKDGTISIPNMGNGIMINAASGTVIGTEGTIRKQVIAGNNGQGIKIQTIGTGEMALNSKIVGNIIGLGADGTTGFGNGQYGIYISAGSADPDSINNTVIGSDAVNGRNVVAAHNSANIYLTGSTQKNTSILNNYIGTNSAGDTKYPIDSAVGILIEFGAYNTRIGDASGTGGNLISGNDTSGIKISSSNGNIVEGNLIGTQADGTTPLGNGGNGILLTSPGADATGNIIGGSLNGANVISNNGIFGVFLSRQTSNVVKTTITYNSIFGNTSAPIGFNFGSENGGIATPAPPTTLIGYPHMVSLSDVPGAGYLVQVYAGLGTDAEIFVGEATSTATGTLMVPVDIAALDGYQIKAHWTETVSGNTSRFSPVGGTLSVPPTLFVDVNGSQADPTNSTPIIFDVSADEKITGLDSLDFINTGTAGEPTYTLTNPSMDNKTFVLTITNVPGDGTIIPQAGVSTFQDLASSPNPNTGVSVNKVSDGTVTFDTTPPTVSIGTPTPTATSTNPVAYTVTYTGASSINLTNGDITLNTTGTATASLSVANGTTSTPTVSLSGISGDGTLGITIGAGTAADAAGNSAAGAGPSTTVLVDNTGPVMSIGAPSPTATQSGPVDFPVMYSGANTVNLTTGDVTLNTTGTASGTISVTNGTTSTPTVTISSITGEGTVGISITPETAFDNVGNIANGDGPSATATVDNTPPTITVGSPSQTVTNTGPVTYSPVYSGASTINLTTGDVSLNTTGTATGTVNVTNGTTATPTITISGISGDGTIGINIAAGTAVDAAGNSAGAEGPSITFTVDNAAPTLTIGSPSKSSTGTGPVSYLVTYSGADTINLLPGDITLNKTGNAVGTVSVVDGTTATPTVTISAITGDGTIGFSIAAATASDNAGNNALAAGPGITFVVDNTAPTLAIGTPSASLTTTGPVSFPVTYTGASDIDLMDTNVTLNSTGTATGTITVINGTTATPTVTVSGIAGDGTLGISIDADTAIDGVGNSAPGAGPSAVVTVDNTAPTILIGSPSVPIVAGGPVTFDLIYSGASTVNLTAGDLTLNSTESATGTLSVFGGNTTTPTVTIGTISGDGSLGISIAAGTANDGLGNVAGAAGPSSSVTVDNTAPVVTVDTKTTGDATPTLTGTTNDASLVTITITVDNVTYLAVVTGNTWTADVSTALADGTHDVVVTGTDSAGNEGFDDTTNELVIDTRLPSATINNIVTSDTTPTLTGTVTSESTVTSVVISVVGADYTATVVGGSWSADVTSALSQGSYDVTITSTNSLNLMATENFPGALVVDLSTPTITVDSLVTSNTTPTLSGTLSDGTSLTVSVAVGSQTVTATVSGNSWTATVPAPLADGVYDVMATATTLANNMGTDSTTDELTIDSTPPTIGFSSDESSPTVNSPISVSILISEPVTNLVPAQVTLTNATLFSYTQVNATRYDAVITPAAPGVVRVEIGTNAIFDQAENGNTENAIFTITYMPEDEVNIDECLALCELPDGR